MATVTFAIAEEDYIDVQIATLCFYDLMIASLYTSPH